MQASRKFAKRPSKQPLWVSEFDSPASGVGVLVLFAAAALLLCDCCPDSTSLGPTTFCAIELQISQVLKIIRIFFFFLGLVIEGTHVHVHDETKISYGH